MHQVYDFPLGLSIQRNDKQTKKRQQNILVKIISTRLPKKETNLFWASGGSFEHYLLPLTYTDLLIQN